MQTRKRLGLERNECASGVHKVVAAAASTIRSRQVKRKSEDSRIGSLRSKNKEGPGRSMRPGPSLAMRQPGDYPVLRHGAGTCCVGLRAFCVEPLQRDLQTDGSKYQRGIPTRDRVPRPDLTLADALIAKGTRSVRSTRISALTRCAGRARTSFRDRVARLHPPAPR